MSFDAGANPPCFRSDKENEIIQPNDGIRIRILGVRIHAQDIVSVVFLKLS